MRRTFNLFFIAIMLLSPGCKKTDNQAPANSFLKIYDEVSYNTDFPVVQTPSGGYLVLIGQDSGSWLFRFDASGNQTGKTVLPGITADEFPLLIKSNQGVVIAGSTPNDSTGILAVCSFDGQLINEIKIDSFIPTGIVTSFTSGYIFTGDVVTSFNSNVHVVIKTDLNLNIVWKKEIKAFSRVVYITKLFDRYIICGGKVDASYNAGLSCEAINDSGNIIKSADLTNSSQFTNYTLVALCPAADGNVIIFYENSTSLNLFSLLINQNLDTIRTYSGFNAQNLIYGQPVLNLSDGTYLLSENIFNQNGDGITLLHFDAGLHILWQRLFFPKYGCSNSYVSQTNDGGFIISGLCNAGLSKNGISFMLMKTDANGNIGN